MAEEERLDVAAAAQRHGCGTQAIWRRIRRGDLPVRKEKVTGRDGRRVIKTLIRVADLDDAFGSSAHDEHVRKVRESAKPLTVEQKVALRKVYLEHRRDREAKRRRARSEGATTLRSLRVLSSA